MIPPTFQIGDEVLITGPTGYGSEKRMGEKFEIETHHKEGPAFGGRDLYSGRGFPWYPASSLRLAPQFTIGNLVEVVRASNYDSRHLVGEKFTIDDIEGDRYTAVGYPWIRADCLRLVEELKIGDWVEVIGPDGALNDYYRGRKFRISQTPRQASDMFSCEFYPNYFPTKSLRKLTLAEALCHITKRPSEYIDASLEGRISAIEKQLKEQQKKISQFDGEISHLMGSIQECLMESGDVEARARCREMAIEKRLDFVEKFQRGQEEFVRRWTAGP